MGDIYRLAGFGDSYDGDYTENGTGNGKPIYELDSTHWLSFDSSDLLVWGVAPGVVAPGTYFDHQSNSVNAATPDLGTWDSGGTVTLVVADSTPPTYDSTTGASVPTTGNRVDLPMIEADSAPILPATGATGFYVIINGKKYTAASTPITSLVAAIPVPITITSTDTVKAGYDSATGNVTDSAGTPNEMASFGPVTVDNGSTVPRVLKKPVVFNGAGFENLQEGDQLIQPAPVPVQTLTDGATITWDVSDAPISKAAVTLGGNRTLALEGITNGSQGVLFVKQDSTGSRTLALPDGSLVAGGGSGAISLSTDAAAVDALAFVSDGTNIYWTKGLSFT